MEHQAMSSNVSEPCCYLIMRRYTVAEQFQSRFLLLRYEKEIESYLYRMIPDIARIYIDNKTLTLLYLDNGFAPKDLPYNVWKGLNNIVHGHKAVSISTTYLYAEYHIFEEDMEARDTLVEYRISNDC
ncbi:MAG: hypothetical protein E7260_09155 [Lachnospiraceae bacterium]|nr:hypothetical protein [Lachnospiraceae bacterium]